MYNQYQLYANLSRFRFGLSFFQQSTLLPIKSSFILLSLTEVS